MYINPTPMSLLQFPGSCPKGHAGIYYLVFVHNVSDINISYLRHLCNLLITIPDFRQGLQIFRRYATF